MFKYSYAVSIQATTFAAVGSGSGNLDFLEEMRGLGFDAVELAIRNPAEIDQAQLIDAVARSGLGVSALGTGQAFLAEGLSLSDPDPTVRSAAISRIGAHIDLAKRWGALVIIGLIRGRMDEASGRDSAVAFLTESLSRCCERAEEADVNLVIEPINRYECGFLNSLDETVAFVEEFGHRRLKILADTFHMNIEDREVGKSMCDAGSHVAHVHIADSNRMFPGQGHIDFGSVLLALHRIGYSGYLSGEMLPLPTQSEAMEGFINYFKNPGGLEDK